MMQEMMGKAVASAGPYANNLHLGPDRQPHQHLITKFLQARCSSWCPTNNVKALKALEMNSNIFSLIRTALNAFSKGMQIVKLCSNKILQ